MDEFTCSVKPLVNNQVLTIDDVSFQVLCTCNGVEAELKLLSAGVLPTEDPNSCTKLLLFAILVPNSVPISVIEVQDSSNRDRVCWLRILKKLPSHVPKSADQIQLLPLVQPTQASPLVATQLVLTYNKLFDDTTHVLNFIPPVLEQRQHLAIFAENCNAVQVFSRNSDRKTFLAIDRPTLQELT